MFIYFLLFSSSFINMLIIYRTIYIYSKLFYAFSHIPIFSQVSFMDHFLLYTSVSIVIRGDVIVISIFIYFWDMLSVSVCDLSLKIFCVHLGRMCIHFFWYRTLCKYLLSPFGPVHHVVGLLGVALFFWCQVLMCSWMLCVSFVWSFYNLKFT